jgi:predicted HTH domain antitoxin
MTMTDEQIIALFDSTNITLADLSRISGRSVPALKKLLMGA